MEEKIREAIRDLFENAPDSQEAKELQEEMISNAEEKYSDLMQRGFTDEQAYTMVMASIGDVQELLADIGAQAEQEEIGEDPTENTEGKRSEYWEKQSEFWKWQGEYWEKQARNLGHQAKGALNTILESGVWENMTSGVKQFIGNVGSSFQSDDGAYTDMELRNSRRFSKDGVRELILELQNSAVDLDVQLTTDEEILIQEYYNKEPQKGQLLEFNLSGSELKIRYGSGAMGVHRRGTVKVMLPESLAGDLELFRAVTVSGDITLQDMGAAKQSYKTVSGDVKGKAAIGDVTVNTVSGNVEFELLDGSCQINSVSGDITLGKVTGKLTQNTTSGDFSVGQMSGKLSQNAVSGDVEIRELDGDGSFHTVSGDVSVHVVKAGERLELSTGSGDIEVVLPQEAGVQMTLGTGSGDIHTFCDHMAQTEEHVAYEKHGSKRAVGTVGTEPFLQLKASSGSGDIEVGR